MPQSGACRCIRQRDRVDCGSRCQGIEREGIQGCDLYTTDALCLHLFQLSLQLWLRDGRTEPPPAHHDASLIRRVSKERPRALTLRSLWARHRPACPRTRTAMRTQISQGVAGPEMWRLVRERREARGWIRPSKSRTDAQATLHMGIFSSFASFSRWLLTWPTPTAQ
jgi:hypothetical protein